MHPDPPCPVRTVFTLQAQPQHTSPGSRPKSLQGTLKQPTHFCTFYGNYSPIMDPSLNMSTAPCKPRNCVILIPADPNPSLGPGLRIEGPEISCVVSLPLREVLPNQSQSICAAPCVLDVALSSPCLGYRLRNLLQSGCCVAGTRKSSSHIASARHPEALCMHLIPATPR